MPTFGSRHRHRHGLNGGALQQIINMSTLISPTQGGFHKPNDPDRVDSAIDGSMTVCAAFQSHIVRIFRDLCAPGQPVLSRDRFADFLTLVQGEELVHPLDREYYTFPQFFEVWHYQYRVRPLRKLVLGPEDLCKPISHYFINSSHNTYLLGNQLTSASSVDAYSTALEQDCRCIEIDVWNGPNATPNRSRSPRPDSKRHRSTSSVSSAVEEITSMLLGRPISHHRSPSSGVSGNKLAVPSPRTSQVALDPGSSSAVAEDGPSEDELRAPRARSRSLADPNAEPVVMHAHTYLQRDYTLGNPIGFRAVCRAIRRSAFAKNHLPIIISLEVHADTQQQDVMVDIMRQEWGDHLLDEAFLGCDPRLRLPRLNELTDKILVKVKKASVLEDSNGTADSLGIPFEKLKKDRDQQRGGLGGLSGGSSSDEEGGATAKRPLISKKLSSLAVYTHSKRFGGFRERVAKTPSHIFSLHENSIQRLHRQDPEGMAAHNRSFLMRAYPDPVARVDSGNMDPSACWSKGVQMVAMNWQTLDSGMMLNHAMFADTAGWAPKPPALRGGTDERPQQRIVTIGMLKLTLFAGQSIPPIKGKSATSFDPCVKVALHVEGRPEPLKQSLSGRKTSHPDWGPDGASVVFKDVAGVAEDFSFLKLRVEDDGALSSWACYRLDRLLQGYRFLDLLDPRGKPTEGRLLVKIEKNLRPTGR